MLPVLSTALSFNQATFVAPSGLATVAFLAASVLPSSIMLKRGDVGLSNECTPVPHVPVRLAFAPMETGAEEELVAVLQS